MLTEKSQSAKAVYCGSNYMIFLQKDQWLLRFQRKKEEDINKHTTGVFKANGSTLDDIIMVDT